MVALVVFGIAALFLLQTDEFPKVAPPVVTVSIPYPGASPGTVEREVAEPIEDAIASISGVDKVHSLSYDGFALLVVEFLFSKDLQQATQDIRDEISELRQDLPPEMEEPILSRFDPADLPIMSITLSSDTLDSAALTKIADPGITREVQGIPGVASVNLIGGEQAELVVELVPAQLEASGISVAQVVQALQVSNLAAPVGRVTDARTERTIRLQGRLEGPEDFEAMTVAATGDRLVRLGDVAHVRAGTEEPRSLALYGDQPAVGIDIVKATGASTTDVSHHLHEVLDRIRPTLPEGVKLDVVRDAGERVHHSVREVQITLVEGALLTVLVVFAFLGSWRSTVITGLALPVSVLASFIAVWAFGYTLNTMSLMGLSLAIGILVDDAIVVRENIVRHMEMGKDHFQAAREGTAEIGLAVAATTFSIVVVFVPVAFMGGVAEQWLGPMALTIAASVMVSLFVSFSLDPMLSAYWPDPAIHTDHRANFIGRLVHKFDKWLERQIVTYQKVIRWALNHRIAMSAIAFFAFVGALAMPATGIVGGSFFPDQDRSEFILNLEVPPGSSLTYTRDKAAEVARLTQQVEGVMYTYTTIGGQGGTVDEAMLYARLTPKRERDTHADILAERARRKADALAGVTASVGTGFIGNEKQIQLQLQGPDIRVLADIADQLAERVKTVPGAADVGLSTRGQRPELEVLLDRPLAASLGLSVAQVAQALRPAFAGIDVGDWIDPTGETREVTVRFTPEARERPEDLESLPLVVQSATGSATIPLGQIAQVRQSMGPAMIQHLDRDRVIAVEANSRGLPLSEVTAGIEQEIEQIHWPPGYGVIQGGDVEAQTEVFGRMFGALGVAILLMYLILVVQFGSFLDPLPIMASLPLSLIGVMIALLVSGSTLNLMSMIGVILLMGIVAKNAILLVDFAKWAEEAGMERKEAIVEAGATRLRPILMTSVAIVAGMLPVAIGAGEGADFRAPLGRAVIGGVITSTFLTLLVIPTFYDMMSSVRDWFGARFAPGARHATPPVLEPEVPDLA
jgi:HAE1 family hydrophobic/amphiphilic exporter-1